MAHMRRKVLVFWYLDGKRVPSGTPGAEKRKTLSECWYAFGLRKLPIKLGRDRKASQRLFEELIRDQERGEAGLPLETVKLASLEEYLGRFAADVRDGLASRTHRRNVPTSAQADLVIARVRTLLEGIGARAVSDLDPRTVNQWLRDNVRAGTLSAQTASFYLSALRRFAWWLSRQRVGIRADLFADLPGFQPHAHRTRERGALIAEEVGRLLAEARSSPVVMRKLSGLERHWLYRLALATGFRVQELARLTISSFQLEQAPPLVQLPARSTKSKRVAVQPLPVGLVPELRDWLATRPAIGPIWPRGSWSRKAAEVLAVDLEAAKVPQEVPGPHGLMVRDFHSLRHTYVTWLMQSGASPKDVQELARHSSAELTLGVYSHASSERLASAVNALPLGSAIDPEEQAMADKFSKQAVERAKQDQLLLVCLEINGKYAKRDSWRVSGAVGPETRELVYNLLNHLADPERRAK